MSESMKDFESMLEESYSMMGDGVHDTDALLAWKKAEELRSFTDFGISTYLIGHDSKASISICWSVSGKKTR